MTFYQRDGVLIVKPGIYLDINFKNEISDLVRAKVSDEHQVLLLNLTDVEVINSHGISGLLSVYDRLDETNGTLAFCHIQSHMVENAFQICGLTALCADFFYETEDDAIADLTALLDHN